MQWLLATRPPIPIPANVRRAIICGTSIAAADRPIPTTIGARHQIARVRRPIRSARGEMQNGPKGRTDDSGTEQPSDLDRGQAPALAQVRCHERYDEDLESIHHAKNKADCDGAFLTPVHGPGSNRFSKVYDHGRFCSRHVLRSSAITEYSPIRTTRTAMQTVTPDALICHVTDSPGLVMMSSGRLW